MQTVESINHSKTSKFNVRDNISLNKLYCTKLFDFTETNEQIFDDLLRKINKTFQNDTNLDDISQKISLIQKFIQNNFGKVITDIFQKLGKVISLIENFI